MKKTITSLTLLLFLTGSMIGQDFNPSGKAFMKVFTNYHSTFGDDKTHNAFDLQRAYFGYSASFNEKFSGKVTLDVGNPGVGKLNMTAYLKNAYFQYMSGRLTTKFGLIGLSQFSLQEKQWGNRYIYKSFMDEHKFGSSADLGIFASYKLHDMVSIDATIANGDGYKSLETDSVFKYSAGITVMPLTGLNVRFYYDIMGSEDAQQNMSFYAGYSKEALSLGAELNLLSNYKMVAGENKTGLSFFGAYAFEKFRVYGRYDQLSSPEIGDETDPWNYASDGKAIIVGVEFSPIKGIKISPNYQGWIPADGSSLVNGAYISCEIKM